MFNWWQVADKLLKDARLEIRLPSATKEQMEADAAVRGNTASQLVLWLYDQWVKAGKPDKIK